MNGHYSSHKVLLYCVIFTKVYIIIYSSINNYTYSAGIKERCRDGCRTSLLIAGVVLVPNIFHTLLPPCHPYITIHFMEMIFSTCYFAVPPPDVAVSLNRTGPLYAGTDLTISCTVTLDQSVNNNETVSIHWNVEMGDHYILINDVKKVSENNYSSSLTISPLTDQDSDSYICNGTVSSKDRNVLSASNVAVVTVSVEGKCFF